MSLCDRDLLRRTMTAGVLLRLLVLCSLLLVSLAASAAGTHVKTTASAESIQSLRELCGKDSPPGHRKGVFYAPLDHPPEEDVSNRKNQQTWLEWVDKNVEAVLGGKKKKKKKKKKARSFAARPNAETLPNFLGHRVQLTDCETVENLRRSLKAEGTATNLITVDKQVPMLGKIMKQLGSDMDRQVNECDAYIAQPHAGSYGWHIDSVDNLLYCIGGRKQLQVAGIELGSPIEVDVLLKPGDAVYVPAGHYHIGVGGTEESIIWSIGLLQEDFDDDFRDAFYRKQDYDGQVIEELGLLTWEDARKAREDGSFSRQSDL